MGKLKKHNTKTHLKKKKKFILNQCYKKEKKIHQNKVETEKEYSQFFVGKYRLNGGNDIKIYTK